MKTNVGVFFGGRSVEHEISIISALQAINAMNNDKYSVTPIYVTKQGTWYSGNALLEVDNYRNTDELLKKCTQVYMRPEYENGTVYTSKKKMFGSDEYAKLDVVFPVFHGTNGEDGSFQGLLELIGLPYVGCPPLASVNGMDKITMKMILRESNIPIIDFQWFSDKQWFAQKEELINKIESNLGYPVIVKPANLGSSVGISRATDKISLIKAIELAIKFSSRIIVEKMVVNLKEINCSVLGNNFECITSVCEEPVKTDEILSYTDKYMGGSKNSGPSKGMQSTQRRIPADLPQDMSDKIREYAAETFHVLSCDGVSRIDFIIDEKTDAIYVNEINTIPGSLSFYLWDATGMSFDKLIDKLIDLALKRNRDASMKTTSYDANIFSLKGGAKGCKMGSKR